MFFNAQPSYRTGVLLVVLAGTFWSLMGIGLRSIEEANVWQICFFRSCALIPFLLLIITVHSFGNPIKIMRNVGIPGIIGGFGLFMAFVAGIYAVQVTTVANAMFLFAAAPFFAAFLGWVVLKEKVRAETWICMFIGFIGIAIMVWQGATLGHLNGNLSAILSALGFAVFTIALRWGKLNDMMPTVIIGGIITILASGLICFTENFTLIISLHDIIISMLMGIFQVGTGLVLYTIGSKSVPAAELTLLSMTEVLLGPLWVWIIFDEIAGFYTILGGLMLLGSIAGNAISGAKITRL